MLISAGLWKAQTMQYAQRRMIRRLVVVTGAIWKQEVFVSLLAHVCARWMSWLVVKRQALAVALTPSVYGLRLSLHVHLVGTCRQEAVQTTGRVRIWIWSLDAGTTLRRLLCVAAQTCLCTTICTAMSRAHLR